MPDEKKIIIDEDWKSRVQAEKEAAAKHPTGEPASAGGEQPSSAKQQANQVPPIPPASFEMLVTTLATEALVALGQVPHPVTGKAELQRDHAQYLIDTLDVLRLKTKGNLTPQEQELIDSVLHQMRMLFVATATVPANAPANAAN
jgi:Domain of unknown function (DUF1844)